MADLWYPAAVRNVASSSLWGTYLAGVPLKGVLHTTESTWYHPFGAGPSSTYDGFGHDYFPQFTLDDGGTVYQHIPANRAGRALKHNPGTTETNRAGAVQVEMVGTAVGIRSMPAAQRAGLRGLVDWWVSIGIKRKFPPQGFKPYPASYGAGNGIRFTSAVWLAWDGICGHQHVPGNEHGDPGDFDLSILTGQEDDMTDAQAAQLSSIETICRAMLQGNWAGGDLSWLDVRISAVLAAVAGISIPGGVVDVEALADALKGTLSAELAADLAARLAA